MVSVSKKTQKYESMRKSGSCRVQHVTRARGGFSTQLPISMTDQHKTVHHYVMLMISVVLWKLHSGTSSEVHIRGDSLTSCPFNITI